MSLFSIQTFITGNMKQEYNPFEDEDLKTAWSEWEQHRKEKKQKLTPLSVKKQLKFLQGKSKEEIIAIIDQSIMNGYQGLFDLKKPLQPQMKVVKFTMEDLNQKTG